MMAVSHQHLEHHLPLAPSRKHPEGLAQAQAHLANLKYRGLVVSHQHLELPMRRKPRTHREALIQRGLLIHREALTHQALQQMLPKRLSARRQRGRRATGRHSVVLPTATPYLLGRLLLLDFLACCLPGCSVLLFSVITHKVWHLGAMKTTSLARKAGCCICSKRGNVHIETIQNAILDCGSVSLLLALAESLPLSR